MVPIARIGYARFETPDLARQLDYYTAILGLEATERTTAAAWLSCPLDPHSISLQSGTVARCTELGFHLAAQSDLGTVQAALRARGLAVERRQDAEPGIPDLLRLTDPKGTHVTLYPEPAMAPRPYRTGGVGPTSLGHVAFNVPDVARAVDFYCDVLGFRFSDSIEDFFVWLRCNPNHHTVNFVRGTRVKMHHIAFEVRDFAHLQIACDLLSRNAIPTIWGPGRHGCGHNLFTYHRDPDGHIIELFCEMDQMREELGYYEPRPWHRDRPQIPKIWPADPAASNLWGPMPPPGFLD